MSQKSWWGTACDRGGGGPGFDRFRDSGVLGKREPQCACTSTMAFLVSLTVSANGLLSVRDSSSRSVKPGEAERADFGNVMDSSPDAVGMEGAA